MKQEVLLTGDFLAPEVRARLESAFAVSVLPKAGPEREAFLAAGCDAEAVAATGHSGADAALIGALPRLKIVACYGVGYDCIDVAAATARGAWVSNTPDVLNDDTADLALALALAVVRRIPAAERYARGEWETGGDYVLTDGLSGRRLGMLGMGRIGGAIVRRALGFGMEISYHATARKPESPYRWAESPKALAAGCDVLCVAAPATAATRGMVDAEVLRALGAEGYLVNIARGALVDEAALISALQNKVIAGAGLDVFADEPRVPEALKGMDNVVLSPHQGSATVRTRLAMSELVADNIGSVLRGDAPLTPVNNPDTPDTPDGEGGR